MSSEQSPSPVVSVPAPLALPRELLEQINADAQRAYPNECCGILFGQIGQTPDSPRVAQRLTVVNNAFETGEQYHRFSITGRDLLAAERQAGQWGMLVLGFYHSHPDHPARPSEFDRLHAWPFYSYIIVAVEKGVAGEMTCWQLDETSEQFAPQRLLQMP